MTDSDETLNPFQLASVADCGTPDRADSEGAQFLLAIAEACTKYRDGYADDDSDAAHEIADGFVPIYTHAVWETFVDLAAYREDPSELGFSPSERDGFDMEQAAKVCLYIIGERLASVLLASAADDDAEEVDA